MTRTLTITIDSALLAEMRRIADKEHRSLSNLAGMMLAQGIVALGGGLPVLPTPPKAGEPAPTKRPGYRWIKWVERGGQRVTLVSNAPERPTKDSDWKVLDE